MPRPPASFFKRGRFIHVSYYLPGRRDRPVSYSTGVEWNEEFQPVPLSDEWYTKPRHERARQIKRIADAIRSQKQELQFKRRFPGLVKAQEIEEARSYTLRHLKDLYVQHKADRRSPLSTATVKGIDSALRLVEGFKTDLSLQDLTDDTIDRLETYLYKSDVSLSSLKLYLDRLKALVNFAVSKKWIDANPLRRITIKPPDKVATHDEFEHEVAYALDMWEVNRKAAAHMLFERLTGFRAIDGIKLLKTDVHLDKAWFNGYNEKKKRREAYPVHSALAILFELVWDMDPVYVLPYRDYHQVLYAARESAVKLAVSGTHQWKRNYARDIQDAEPPKQIEDLLLHHAPDDLKTRYMGKSLEKMRKYAEIALAKWVPVLEQLKGN